MVGRAGRVRRTPGRPLLLEREDEVSRIRGLIASVHESGAVAVVEGPPGIGKTELLSMLAAEAADAGFAVLTARGDELEQDFALGVARQLLGSTLAMLDPEAREALLAGPAALAVPAVDPAAPPQGVGAMGDPFPLLHGLYWLTAGLAEMRPLAIVVDDAHWADRPSLRWLHYLARRLDGLPVLVTLASRSTRPEAPVPEVEAIKAEADTVVLRPGPLSESASRVLLGEVFDETPDGTFAHAAHTVTGGNPFLLRELGQAVAADGLAPDAQAARRLPEVTTDTITHTVLSRLARLPSEARELARASSILGEQAELRHATALAGLEEAQALEALDQLDAAGLMEVERPNHPGSGLVFAHPLIRQALYTDLGPGERAARHKAAAKLIAEDRTVERAAAHLLHTVTASDPWVVETLREAALVALGSGAPESAASYLERAVDEPPTSEVRSAVLVELGRARALMADPRAITDLRQAASVSTHPAERVAALGALVPALHMAGDDVAAFTSACDALNEIPPGAGGIAEAWLLSMASWAGRAKPELIDRAGALLTQSRLQPGGGATAGEVVRRIALTRDALLEHGGEAAREHLGWLATQSGEIIDADEAAHLVLGLLGHVQVLADHSDAAEHTLQCALELSRRRGDKLVVGGSHVNLAFRRWRAGDIPGAMAAAQATLDLPELGDAEWGPLMGWRIWARLLRALCLAEHGDLPAASASMSTFEAIEDQLVETWWWLWLPYVRSTVALACEEWDEARSQALVAGERLDAIRVRTPIFLPWRSLAARAASRQGDPEVAAELADDELQLARAAESPRAIGIALTSVGLAASGEAGVTALREAVQVLEGTPARLEHARALVELGGALRRANRRADAREPLQAGIELARGCGAFPLAERAHAELQATGARPRTLVFTGVQALTPRERQVAELAAAGRSNPEIAQALYVTRKTVETHLGAVFRKLEIVAREQLGDAFTSERP